MDPEEGGLTNLAYQKIVKHVSFQIEVLNLVHYNAAIKVNEMWVKENGSYMPQKARVTGFGKILPHNYLSEPFYIPFCLINFL